MDSYEISEKSKELALDLDKMKLEIENSNFMISYYNKKLVIQNSELSTKEKDAILYLNMAMDIANSEPNNPSAYNLVTTLKKLFNQSSF